MVVVGLLFSRALFPHGMQPAFLGRNVGRQKWRLLASSAASGAAATRSMSSYPIALLRRRFSALKTGAKERVSLRSAPLLVSRRLTPFHEIGSRAGSDAAAKTTTVEADAKAARRKRRRWAYFYVALVNLLGFFFYSQYRDADVLTEGTDNVKAVAVGFWVSPTVDYGH